jgi:hypothetical protein
MIDMSKRAKNKRRAMWQLISKEAGNVPSYD